LGGGGSGREAQIYERTGWKKRGGALGSSSEIPEIFQKRLGRETLTGEGKKETGDKKLVNVG